MSKITDEEIEKLETIMLDFGEAHNLLAKSTLSKEEYQPISGLLAKAKIELFNFKVSLQNKVSDEEIEKLATNFHVHFGYIYDQREKKIKPKEIVKWFIKNCINFSHQNKVSDPATEQSTSSWQKVGEKDKFMDEVRGNESGVSAKDIFKELWYKRNPVHETNSDTGEDMFWRTAELVAREYASIKNKVSDVSAEEIDLASQRAYPIVSWLSNFDALMKREAFKNGVKWHASIVNKKYNVGSVIKIIDEILLSKAKELNLYIDFSDKEYDGDKEAPMDRIGLLDYLVNKRKDNVVNDAIEIVKKLAEWSNKYPRGGIYHISKISMDEELIYIEELAKKFIESQPK